MSDVMTIEERILSKFVEKLESDESIPPEVASRILVLWKDGALKDAEAILKAIKDGVQKEGVEDDAKNSTA